MGTSFHLRSGLGFYCQQEVSYSTLCTRENQIKLKGRALIKRTHESKRSWLFTQILGYFAQKYPYTSTGLISRTVEFLAELLSSLYL